ncbi:uncharacterized protein LOC132284167 [Cornus florida]|uniref:uncharacterized protein LOC132284167 n=1 Tax=Cornus florida TaxID=4283 RepID=UPI0028994921|nr:uncharacterized protein LOC132284167 [Cornus florida]
MWLPSSPKPPAGLKMTKQQSLKKKQRSAGKTVMWVRVAIGKGGSEDEAGAVVEAVGDATESGGEEEFVEPPKEVRSLLGTCHMMLMVRNWLRFSIRWVLLRLQRLFTIGKLIGVVGLHS